MFPAPSKFWTVSRGRSWSADERRWLTILIAIGFVSRAVLALRSNALVSTRPYIDDAFYILSCARQIALGNGLTADGVHLTNGVQPLIVLLDVPFFLLSRGDRWLGLKLTFVLVALTQAIGTYFVASVCRLLERRTERPVEPTRAPWRGSVPLLSRRGSGQFLFRCSCTTQTGWRLASTRFSS